MCWGIPGHPLAGGAVTVGGGAAGGGGPSLALRAAPSLSIIPSSMAKPPTPGMTPQAKQVQRTYLLLTLFSTLAASFIWGINTLFLLDAGLDNAEAFTANAFFTAGMVVFEVPTGVLADTWGRRRSYLLGAATLLLSTLLYLVMWQARAPLWGWAIASALIGLGFTFFSGSTEAWLVDALASNPRGKLSRPEWRKKYLAQRGG